MNYIKPQLTSASLRLDLWLVLWICVFVVSARMVAGLSSFPLTLAWLILTCFLIPVLMPIRYLIATIIATIIFFDASLWFLQGNMRANTIYEAPGALIKPPELLLGALAIRHAVTQLSVGWPPRRIVIIVVLWLLVVGAGLATATLNRTDISDALIFSEFRSPAIMSVGFLLLAPLVKLNRTFFVDIIGLAIFVHFAISLFSWITKFSILWESYAPNYFGSHAAFFGADESIFVYLMGATLALSITLSPYERGQITFLPKSFWTILSLLALFAILASLRRGGIATFSIIAATAFIFTSTRIKFMAMIAAATSLPMLLFTPPEIGILDALLSRIDGEGTVAQSDSGREMDVVQARMYLANHFWLGTGPGTKLALWRTQAYDVADSLSIHHSIYHVSVRFGAIGAISYSLLFAIPLLDALRMTLDSSILPRSLRMLDTALMGLLVGIFIWGLYIPAIYINFRQSGVWILACALIYSTVTRTTLGPLSIQKFRCRLNFRK